MPEDSPSAKYFKSVPKRRPSRPVFATEVMMTGNVGLALPFFYECVAEARTRLGHIDSWYQRQTLSAFCGLRENCFDRQSATDCGPCPCGITALVFISLVLNELHHVPRGGATQGLNTNLCGSLPDPR